jgi:RNA polymerase sigma factor (sigma-70 family)
MKQLSKLTPQQQQLVSQALQHALAVARKHARLYGPRLDFEGAVALWLCQEIAKFDPKKSSLKTWAGWQGHFACRNLMRSEIPVKSRKKCFRRAQFLSLDTTFDQSGVPIAEQIAAPPEHPVDIQEDKLLLRGLDTRTRTILWNSIVEEIPLKAIAQSLGVSEARISKLRTSGIEFLRQRTFA